MLWRWGIRWGWACRCRSWSCGSSGRSPESSKGEWIFVHWSLSGLQGCVSSSRFKFKSTQPDSRIWPCSCSCRWRTLGGRASRWSGSRCSRTTRCTTERWCGESGMQIHMNYQTSAFGGASRKEGTGVLQHFVVYKWHWISCHKMTNKRIIFVKKWQMST